MLNLCRVKILIICLPVLILFSSPSIATPSLAEQQKEQIRTLLADMNQSAKEVADTVISEPQSAEDAGCLSDVQGIDLSLFTVDLLNVWGALYDTIKDQIISGTCDAATNYINQQSGQLDTNLEAPFGLGSISISQSSAIDDWQSVVTSDVELDNTELVTKVTTDTLGQVPPPSVVSNSIQKAESSSDTPSHNKKEIEESLEEMLSLKTLFEEDDQGN